MRSALADPFMRDVSNEVFVLTGKYANTPNRIPAGSRIKIWIATVLSSVGRMVRWRLLRDAVIDPSAVLADRGTLERERWGRRLPAFTIRQAVTASVSSPTPTRYWISATACTASKV